MCIARVLRIAAAACALAAASACTPAIPRACAGPAAGAPEVELDAGPWLRVHPGTTLELCLAANCEQLSPSRELTTVQAPPEDHEGAYSLTLKSAGALVIQERVELADQNRRWPLRDQPGHNHQAIDPRTRWPARRHPSAAGPARHSGQLPLSCRSDSPPNGQIPATNQDASRRNSGSPSRSILSDHSTL